MSGVNARYMTRLNLGGHARNSGFCMIPKDELDAGAIYVQIVQPGIVKLPQDFKVEILGQYGNLTVAMPEPALLSAAKLVRGDPRDIEDVAWWVKERALDLDEIRAAIGSLPDAAQREAASENIFLVELVDGEREEVHVTSNCSDTLRGSARRPVKGTYG